MPKMEAEYRLSINPSGGPDIIGYILEGCETLEDAKKIAERVAAKGYWLSEFDSKYKVGTDKDIFCCPSEIRSVSVVLVPKT